MKKMEMMNLNRSRKDGDDEERNHDEHEEHNSMDKKEMMKKIKWYEEYGIMMSMKHMNAMKMKEENTEEFCF